MNTKEKIKESMYHLVASVGYNKASIGQICKEVGISKPSVYYYYDSKKDIFIDLVRDQFLVEYGNYEIFETITDKKAYFDQLYKFGEEIFKGYRDDVEWRMFAAEIDIEATRIPQVRECQKAYEEEVFQKLGRILQRGIEIKALPEDFDIIQEAQLIDAMVIGLNGLAFFEDNKQDVGQIWKLFLEKQFNVEI